MVRPELEGIAGRGPDGRAKTREVKLAAFFTQTVTDQEGHPLRDLDSTSYLASFACSQDFGPLARRAALERGMARAAELIYLGGRSRLGLGNRPHLLWLGYADFGLLSRQPACRRVGQSPL